MATLLAWWSPSGWKTGHSCEKPVSSWGPRRWKWWGILCVFFLTWKIWKWDLLHQLDEQTSWKAYFRGVWTKEKRSNGFWAEASPIVVTLYCCTVRPFGRPVRMLKKMMRKDVLYVAVSQHDLGIFKSARLDPLMGGDREVHEVYDSWLAWTWFLHVAETWGWSDSRELPGDAIASRTRLLQPPQKRGKTALLWWFHWAPLFSGPEELPGDSNAAAEFVDFQRRGLWPRPHPIAEAAGAAASWEVLWEPWLLHAPGLDVGGVKWGV